MSLRMGIIYLLYLSLGEPIKPSMTDFREPKSVLTYAKTNIGGDVQSCTKLTGGICNYVYRLHFNDRTVVLKQFPSTLASNIDYPFSQDRYFVEKEALTKFSKLNSGNVKVPRLIFCQDEEFVLVMEDAGENIVSLMDYFKVCNSRLTWNDLPESIVQFLKTLHNVDRSSCSSIFTNTLARQTNQSFYDNLNLQASRLQLNSLKPYSSVKLPPIPSNPAIIMGDCWPNSIHLDFTTNTIWILDWEFCRFGRGFDDLAQCAANLWLLEQKPDENDVALLKSFRQDLIKQYVRETNTVIDNEDQIRLLVYVVLLANFSNWAFKDPTSIIDKAAQITNSIF